MLPLTVAEESECQKVKMLAWVKQNLRTRSLTLAAVRSARLYWRHASSHAQERK